MLISVLRAVNDFILPAGFSEKDITGGYPPRLVPASSFERGGPGKEQALSLLWPEPAQSPGLRHGRRSLSLLLFRRFSINFLL
jgi:hypothetical protein